MENGDRPGDREHDAATHAFEMARREIEAVSDSNGRASLSDLYRVLDKLNDEIKFGGKLRLNSPSRPM